MNQDPTTSTPPNSELLSLALIVDSDAERDLTGGDPHKYGYPDEIPVGELDEEAQLDCIRRARDMNSAGRL